MPTLGSLPKGRHGLSREQVEVSQRTRLLQATIELATERGFASLTLSDIVQRAGVARSTAAGATVARVRGGLLVLRAPRLC
jgi:hypothetical protein